MSAGNLRWNYLDDIRLFISDAQFAIVYSRSSGRGKLQAVTSCHAMQCLNDSGSSIGGKSSRHNRGDSPNCIDTSGSNGNKTFRMAELSCQDWLFLHTQHRIVKVPIRTFTSPAAASRNITPPSADRTGRAYPMYRLLSISTINFCCQATETCSVSKSCQLLPKTFVL